MSVVREEVEWTYKKVKQLSGSQDLKWRLMVRKSLLALLYRVSAVLWSCNVCLLCGGQTKM